MSTLLRSKCSISRPSNAINLQISTLFLQLPPSYRAFHASPQVQMLDAAITTTHTLLESLHSVTGLPWAYTLPMAALAIRATFILPISIYSRRVSQRQAALTPLLSAWQHQLRSETMREVGHMGPIVVQNAVTRKMRKKRIEIYSRWECGLWKGFLPMVQLPIWLVAIETIRVMCGTKTGLLGIMAAKFFPRGEATDLQDGIPTISVQIEESFATEGALWFPDLLVPDPEMFLPFMLSGAILLNLSNVSGKNNSAWQRRLIMSLRIVALAIGPLTLQIPSAMLLYWTSSSLMAYIQAIILERLMPIKPPVVPCKPRKLALPGNPASPASRGNA